MAGKLEDWLSMYMTKAEEWEKKYKDLLKIDQDLEKKYRVLEKKYQEHQKKYQECGAALEDDSVKKAEVEAFNEGLKGELRTLKSDFARLQKHIQNCEKSTNKAQKDSQHARAYADHVVNSQKGQLRNAERRYELAARELKEWKDKYGDSVNKPAEDQHALQMSVAELQSKAEQARNEIASLEGQIQGTPEQIGLHQALEQWEEHQGCSAEFAELEDKLDDSKRREKKLESDLAASRQQYHKAKHNNKALQIQNQLEQTTQDQEKTNNYMQRIMQLESDLKASIEEIKALQGQVNQLEQDKETLLHQEKIDVDMTDDDLLDKAKVVSDLKALQERHRRTELDMIALKAKAEQIGQANNALQINDKTRNDMFQKLESDLGTAKAEHQATKSNMEILQIKADQLELDLGVAKEQHQKSKSNMEALQEKADQSELDLSTTKQEHEKSKSNLDALQGKADRLELDLETTLEKYRTVKSDMGTLQGKADELESELGATREQYQTLKSDNETLQEKADTLEKEKDRLQFEASEKSGQQKKGNNETVDAVQPDIEDRVESPKQGSSKPEQDDKTQQLRIETPKGAELSQVSSSTYIKRISLFLSYSWKTPYLC